MSFIFIHEDFIVLIARAKGNSAEPECVSKCRRLTRSGETDMKGSQNAMKQGCTRV